jgi:hypothetical protein
LRCYAWFGSKKHTKPVAFFIGLTSFALCLGLSIFTAHLLRRASWTSVLTAETLSENLGAVLRAGDLPNPIQVELPRKEGRQAVRMNYTVDPEMQAWSWKLVKQYHPDYAAVVLLDAQTGEILTLLSFSEFPISQHLALEASFPAASIFKIVTAAAAIDQKILQPESVVTFHGSNHTLYRRNVYGNENNRWVRQMTLIDAFARSVNTVFAKIGMFMLSPGHGFLGMFFVQFLLLGPASCLTRTCRGTPSSPSTTSARRSPSSRLRGRRPTLSSRLWTASSSSWVCRCVLFQMRAASSPTAEC